MCLSLGFLKAKFCCEANEFGQVGIPEASAEDRRKKLK